MAKTDLRATMQEAIEAEEGATTSTGKVIDLCAREALVDSKVRLMAFFPLLQNLEAAVNNLGIATDCTDHVKRAMDFARAWSEDLTRQYAKLTDG